MVEVTSKRFDGHVAVVTGGASGIGLATATEFALEGAAVVILDIDEAGGGAAQQSIAARGGRALFARADVGSPEDCRRAVSAALDAFGGIDYLVNSAVNFVARGLDVTPADWEACLRVNVQGGANMVQACAPALARAGRGAVVNIASISAYIAQPARWTYNSTKGAILALTRCQAMDLAPQRIRVNSVSPGWTWTPEVDRAAGGDRATWEPVWGRFHLLRRCAEPREIARAILFLCSSDASFITAVDLPVDGGYLALGGEGLGEASHFAGSGPSPT
jgi:NAD(P)-dependent dehydrogenase (short-subunit alcohol dehydrogenase family)